MGWLCYAMPHCDNRVASTVVHSHTRLLCGKNNRQQTLQATKNTKTDHSSSSWQLIHA